MTSKCMYAALDYLFILRLYLLLFILRCASAANVVCKDDHVFGSRNILLRHILAITIAAELCNYINKNLIN
jgi:hypothetical protein